MALGNSLGAIRSNYTKTFVFDIVISADASVWSLKDELIILGWDGAIPVSGKVTINSGVTISGRSVTAPAGNKFYSFSVELFHRKSKINIENNGSIIGAGGNGGIGPNVKDVGSPGATALFTKSPITLLNNGIIAGGGGGGGGLVGGGGGGAGIPAGTGGPGGAGCMDFGNQTPCYAARAGTNGTATTGGSGGVPTPPATPSWADRPNGGNGGDLGASGQISGQLRHWPTTSQNKGGSAGYSTFPPLLITLDPASTGTLIGPTGA